MARKRKPFLLRCYAAWAKRAAYGGLDIHTKHISVCAPNDKGQIVHRSQARSIQEMLRVLNGLVMNKVFSNKLTSFQGLHSREACEGLMETLDQRLARGDPAAFSELYDACADRCHHYLVVLLGSRDAADDVLQETFLRLVRKRRSLAGVRNLAAYVFIVARNEALRFAGRRARNKRRQMPLSPADLFVEGKTEDDKARALADLATAALDKSESRAARGGGKKIYGGLTFREIAQVTGVPLPTAATRYRTALERLRAWLASESS